MNILLINHYAGTPELGMEFRPYYLAKEWIKLGHNVTIIASSFSHLRKEVIINNNFYKKENIEGINYIWVRTSKYKGNNINRVKNIFEFVIKLYKLNSYILNYIKPDVIIASSPHPFIIYPVYYFKKKLKAKLVFEVRDLWPLSITELSNISKHNPFILFMQFTESYAYKKSDYVVSLLPNAFEYMKKKGVIRSKFFYISNGVIIDEWQTENEELLPKKHNSLIEKLKKEHFLIGFTGAHGVANALYIFIEAANMLKKEKIKFILVGNGQEKENLINKVKLLKLSNVYFLDSVNKPAIPYMLSCFDVCYIGLQNKELFKFGVSPNKLIDYMMAGKPVIHSINTTNDIVKEANCGISVKAENANALAKAILKIKNMPEAERYEMGKRGKKYIIKNHDYKVLAEKFLKLIKYD
jgi:glycosyltransferase involved in cell wall biosynthesis